MAKIDVVRDHILNQLNLDALPGPARVELMEQMKDIVEKRVMLRIVDSLDQKKQDLFEGLLESGSDVELQAFFELHVPELFAYIEEECKTLTDGMLAHVGAK